MDRRVSRRRVVAALGAAALAGCQGRTGETTPTPITGTTAPPSGGSGVHYTFGRPTGNRLVEGTGSVPDVDPVDVPLGGRPRWLLGTGVDGGSLWVATLEDGTVEAVTLRDGRAARTDVGGGSLPAGTPPVLDARGDAPELLSHPGSASDLTHPVVVGDRTCYVTGDGELVVEGPGGRNSLGVDALVDGRPVTDGRRVAVLAGPTDLYRHAALGDATEPTAVAVVDPAGPELLDRIEMRDEDAFEAILPFWVDPGDGGTFYLTGATSADGARVAAYDEDGTVAPGPRVTGKGWTHRLAVGPLAPDGTREVAAVEKPHVEHRIRFLRRDGDALRVTATLEGYQSHTLSEGRNTDRTRAGDFDGDGRTELLVPRTDQRRVDAVRRVDGGAERAWTLDLGGAIASNLATANRDGRLALGIARADGVLKVWPAT